MALLKLSALVVKVRDLWGKLEPHIEHAETAMFRHFWPRGYYSRILRRDSEYIDEHDEKSTAAAKLPPGEQVRVAAVWITEIYLPSHAEKLFENLSALRLNKRDPWRDPIRMMKENRNFGGSSTALGYLIPMREAKPTSTGSAAPLPAGVRSVFLQSFTPLPGVTAIVAQFRFDDETASRIEQPFSTHYASTVERLRGRTFSTPFGSHIREREIVEIRAALRRRCERWMHEYLPGAYAGLGTFPTPACELLTFATYDPLEGRTAPKVKDGAIFPTGAPVSPPADYEPFGLEGYVTLLRQRGEWDTWASADFPGLIMRPQRDGRDLLYWEQEHLVLSTQVDRFHNEKQRTGADKTSEGVSAATYYLGHSFMLYALWRIVKDFQTLLHGLADQLGSVHLSRKSLRKIARIEQQLADIARNAGPLLRGISKSSDEKWKWDVADFFPVEQDSGLQRSFFQVLASGMKASATGTLENHADLQSTASSVSSLVAAAVNAKQASWNLGLQTAGVLVALGALVLAVVPEWAAQVRSAIAAVVSMVRY